jgi:hypothetical protein
VNSGGINLTNNVFTSSTSNGLYLAGFGITASGNSFYSAAANPLYLVGARNNTFVNNTLSSNTAAFSLAYLTAASYNNTFYWNNFTNASGKYVQDLNGSNYFNNSNPFAFTNLANVQLTVGRATSQTRPHSR